MFLLILQCKNGWMCVFFFTWRQTNNLIWIKINMNLHFIQNDHTYFRSELHLDLLLCWRSLSWISLQMHVVSHAPRFRKKNLVAYCTRDVLNPVYPDGMARLVPPSIHTYVLLEVIKTSFKNIDYGLWGSSFSYSSLTESQLAPYSFRPCDSHRMPLCDKTVPSRFLLPNELLWQFFAPYCLLHLTSNKYTNFDLRLRQFREEVLKVVELWWRTTANEPTTVHILNI